MAVLNLPEKSATVEAIDAAYAESDEHRFSRRLGASIIGWPCERKLWLSFHWAAKPIFEGRMLRLFQTGHLEEDRMAADLRKIGVTVHQVDEVTGKQFEFESCGGHFVCKIDGALLGVKEAPRTWHVWEAKTHNAKSFAKLVAKSVELAKPEHAAQCRCGMGMSGMRRALYEAKNKDNDELHTERIQHDKVRWTELQAKTERVVWALVPPAPLEDDCTWCDYAGVCRLEAEPLRNCRTCMHVTPVNGGWTCDLAANVRAIVNEADPKLYDDDRRGLTYEEQLAGCKCHVYIPALVPGELVEVRPLALKYKTKNGFWWDGQTD